MSREVTNLLYLITIVTFILALRFLSNPATARRGNQIGAVGMLVAIAVTFASANVVSYWEIVVGMVVGGALGAVAALRVKMTAMPQMLHTPLMSGTNAIHGIVLLGSLLVLSSAGGAINKVLLVIAITFGTINIVGGFLVTDRMLEMFKKRDDA